MSQPNGFEIRTLVMGLDGVMATLKRDNTIFDNMCKKYASKIT